jgi:hypothetical protein
MPRKPNYDFERKERERLKKAKKAVRQEAKGKPANAQASGQDVGGDRTKRQK